jgi:hypothetical protein
VQHGLTGSEHRTLGAPTGVIVLETLTHAVRVLTVPCIAANWGCGEAVVRLRCRVGYLCTGAPIVRAVGGSGTRANVPPAAAATSATAAVAAVATTAAAVAPVATTTAAQDQAAAEPIPSATVLKFGGPPARG